MNMIGFTPPQGKLQNTNDKASNPYVQNFAIEIHIYMCVHILINETVDTSK